MISSPRLLLRRWRPEDLAPFAALNGDAETMRYFKAQLTRAESDAMVARLEAIFDEHGYGFWAVEAPGVAPLIGAVGLLPLKPELPFYPGVEIGWRIDKRFWRRGYAEEAARAALAFGFGTLGLQEIVAFTALPNLPSQGVMHKLGMRREVEFDHPSLPEDHPMRRHILYRLPRS